MRRGLDGRKSMFAVDPMNPRGLTDQLADSVRQVIRRGELKPGDRLPGVRTLAADLGTSVFVPHEALKRLVGEGLVVSRRGIGAVVAAHQAKARRGRVLLVHPRLSPGYYNGTFVNVLGAALVRAGYEVLSAYVTQPNYLRHDFEGVREALLDNEIDAVFADGHNFEILKILGDSGKPYFFTSSQPITHEGAVVRIDFDYAKDFGKCVAHCVRAGVRSVLLVVLNADWIHLAERLSARGIAVETLAVKGDDDQEFCRANIQKAATLAVMRRLKRGNRPDLVMFADDYIANGGLLAMAELGIRPPEDVKVVAWLNRGFPLNSLRSLTRMETCPYANGRTVANLIIDYLRTGRRPRRIPSLGHDYIIGDTFPA